ncbi:hypothetical protein G3I60_05295 [Streptomyces sp. SID13666]|uniref:hypothetical protein n=1 Tax=Streptomyces sp. SID13666 TaxID=2706054 RepID=UPI0013C0C963|nr:hypothetical protein [Streptomyces sp. SID13666]NEA53586.1 hypothetical protein [Streptomyces sp. SID13666]
MNPSVDQVPDPPSYPPKTPPPPKRPVQPPRPPIGKAGIASTRRQRLTVANRRGANWTMEAQPWVALGASRRVEAKLREWGYGNGPAVGEVAKFLVTTAVGDGGSRVSLHLADQDQQALVLVLSHQAGLAPADDSVLKGLAAMGVTTCGEDTAPDGRRLWALLDLQRLTAA